jgi:ATP/maltotriose-dependent transcriptional regulator MalT
MHLHRRAAGVERTVIARIRHYLAAQQWSEAADAVDTLRQAGELTGEVEDLLGGCVAGLPPAVLRSYPALYGLAFHDHGAPRLTPAARTLGLTVRQMEVLALLAEGASNREIAERLVITLPTVKDHVGAILHKLKVDERHAAAARAAELGLLRS